MATIRFRGQEILDICATNGIESDVNGDIAFRAIDGFLLTLFDSGAGAAKPPDRFVLCHPASTGMTGILKVCQNKQVPLGFTIQDAVLYQNVFIIGDFSDNNLLTLVHAGCTIQQVAGVNGQERAADLRQKLA